MIIFIIVLLKDTKTFYTFKALMVPFLVLYSLSMIVILWLDAVSLTRCNDIYLVRPHNLHLSIISYIKYYILKWNLNLIEKSETRNIWDE